jgi:hypothetical protein
VLFALADAKHSGLMQAVDLILVRSLLGLNPVVQIERVLVQGKRFCWQLAMQFTDQRSSHGPVPFDRLFGFDSLPQELGQLSTVASAKLNSASFGNFATPMDHLGQKLHVGGEGDVFLLDRGVHQNLAFHGSITMKPDRNLEDELCSLLTDAFSEIDQVRRVTGGLPLEVTFPAERLKVGIADPSLDDSFIAQILKLLEDHQPDHETDRLGRPANGAVEGGELLFEPLPGDAFGQGEQMILGIELIQKVLENEIRLLLVDRFCPHGSHLMLYFPTGFSAEMMHQLVRNTTSIMQYF